MEELHKRLFDWVREKNRKFFSIIQKHLDEILEKFKNEPVKIIKFYEKTISDEYLSDCNSPERLYLFLIFKLSLSELSGKKSVLAYQEKKLKELYTSLPTVYSHLKANFSYSRLLVKTKEREEFLNGVLESNPHLYEKLVESIETYEKLEEISMKDEELESKLAKKIVEVIARHPLRTKKFIETLANQQPSLESYLALLS